MEMRIIIILKHYKMRYLCIVFLALFSFQISAQELFVVTDPASNVPAGSLNVRLGQSLFKEKFESGYNFHFMPEVTWGMNKNLMFRASTFVSNRDSKLVTEGASFYSKYRIFSTDDLNSHFRLAVYGRYSFNNADMWHRLLLLNFSTGNTRPITLDYMPYYAYKARFFCWDPGDDQTLIYYQNNTQ